MRQDPKAYPRTPNPQAGQGAELATKVLRYAIGWDWNDLATAGGAALRGARHLGRRAGPGEGRPGRPGHRWEVVDQSDFFYDTTSIQADFSDARFMGTTRWVELDEAIEQWPDYEDELQGYVDNGPVKDYERGDERYRMTWIDRKRRSSASSTTGTRSGKWFFTLYCGETELEWGESPFSDEKGRRPTSTS